MRLMKYVLVAALTVAPAITFAQGPAPAAQKQTIHQREFNQQRRIANGVRTGRLNGRQTFRLERQQRSIHRQARVMRARNNGRLTMRDRRVLRHRQNMASRRIFRAKHNG
ncbi:MAG TPA: hypothetical protein VKR52_09215 [Terracidiphilus sp.]|nr:hypothetical protein [Terracidiphilus sp.]